MAGSTSGSVDSKQIAFLAMFFARSHRMLYRAQYAGELGRDLGFTDSEAESCALSLQSRGLLRVLSTLSPQGPLVEITPAGISYVQATIAADARSADAVD